MVGFTVGVDGLPTTFKSALLGAYEFITIQLGAWTMRFWTLTLLGLSLAAGLATHVATYAVGGHHCCPQCGASSECCFQEIIVHRCKLVPDSKPIKKIVYEMKEVPYCSHKLCHCDDCDCCAECKACPKYKRQLVKREIVCGEKQGTKCVVEECKEIIAVPCTQCGCRSHCK